ncbi:MAG: asparaginase [Acidobacteria bacterium]|nr:asparaginase [Acidobacteriota bacterium]
MKTPAVVPVLALLLEAALICAPAHAQRRPRIAVFSGPNATMQNTIPLVTSNKARAARGLPPSANSDGSPGRFDHLVPQRLAAPVEVFIEQFSGHPLEKDVAGLYGPPDGYLDRAGAFHTARQNPDDKAVYRVTLRPEDGLYLLPYMALQADGKPWDGVCAFSGAPFEKCRQTFYPDASRLFEEIDRTLAGRGPQGTGNMLGGLADFDFYRALPSGGYTRGLPAAERTDSGAGDLRPEALGEDFFPYAPYRREARLEDLARATNAVQKALNGGTYAGAFWLESSMTVHETAYWLSLLIDTTVPIVANSSQRAHTSVGNDGDRNVIDSAEYILSKAWADGEGRDDLGAVVIQDEQIFASRQIEKQDARPGGYRATGDHGGVLGTTDAPVVIWFRPATLHTWKSAVNLTRLPDVVPGVRKLNGRITQIDVKIKDSEGLLRGDAIPKVTMVRYNHYIHDNSSTSPEEEVEALARIEKNLRDRPLSGFVAEGLIGNGGVHESLEKALAIASLSGLPVVRVSRGDEASMVAANPANLTIEGNNLTPGKARLLLMACLMKFGSLPPAADPANPTPEERSAVQEKIKLYQQIFDTH